MCKRRTLVVATREYFFVMFRLTRVKRPWLVGALSGAQAIFSPARDIEIVIREQLPSKPLPIVMRQTGLATTLEDRR